MTQKDLFTSRSIAELIGISPSVGTCDIMVNCLFIDRSFGFVPPERSQMGCRELRSTKYISDGHCTSIHPIKELVCAGECLPAQMLHNWIGGTHQSKKFWTRRSTATGSNPDWRCVNDKTRTQRIRLQCQDGSTRTYKITVVTSCKCKRFSRQNNESDSGHKFGVLIPPQTQLPHKSKSRKSLGKKHMSQNWHQAAPWGLQALRPCQKTISWCLSKIGMGGGATSGWQNASEPN